MKQTVNGCIFIYTMATDNAQMSWITSALVWAASLTCWPEKKTSACGPRVSWPVRETGVLLLLKLCSLAGIWIQFQNDLNRKQVILQTVTTGRCVSDHRAGNPGYPAVQLHLTSHQWGLRFVLALFKQERLQCLISSRLEMQTLISVFSNPAAISKFSGSTSIFFLIFHFGVHFVTPDNN